MLFSIRFSLYFFGRNTIANTYTHTFTQRDADCKHTATLTIDEVLKDLVRELVCAGAEKKTDFAVNSFHWAARAMPGTIPQDVIADKAQASRTVSNG